MKQQDYTIDASGKALGRLASEIAFALRGKESPAFEPNIAPPRSVFVTNIARMVIDEKKLDRHIHIHHTMFRGGLKRTSLRERLKKSPERLLRETVTGMLPRNRLRKVFLKHLIIQS